MKLVLFIIVFIRLGGDFLFFKDLFGSSRIATFLSDKAFSNKIIDKNDLNENKSIGFYEIAKIKYDSDLKNTLILGDSTSFGFGVDEKDTFVGILRNKVKYNLHNETSTENKH